MTEAEVVVKVSIVARAVQLVVFVVGLVCGILIAVYASLLVGAVLILFTAISSGMLLIDLLRPRPFATFSSAGISLSRLRGRKSRYIAINEASHLGFGNVNSFKALKLVLWSGEEISFMGILVQEDLLQLSQKISSATGIRVD